MRQGLEPAVHCGWAPAVVRSPWPRPAGSPGSCTSTADGQSSCARSPRQGTQSTAPIERLGTTGVFTTTLRQALLRGTVDLVVHSCKDLPTAPVPGLQVVAFPAREDPRDALIWPGGTSLDALPHGARIGTGSPRRAALLRAAGPPAAGRADTGQCRHPAAQARRRRGRCPRAGDGRTVEARLARPGPPRPSTPRCSCPPQRRACSPSSAAPTTRSRRRSSGPSTTRRPGRRRSPNAASWPGSTPAAAHRSAPWPSCRRGRKRTGPAHVRRHRRPGRLLGDQGACDRCGRRRRVARPPTRAPAA